MLATHNFANDSITRLENALARASEGDAESRRSFRSGGRHGGGRIVDAVTAVVRYRECLALRDGEKVSESGWVLLSVA